MSTTRPRSAIRALLATVVVALMALGVIHASPGASARGSAQAAPRVDGAAPDAVDRTDDARARYSKCWRRNKRCYSAVAVNMITGKSFYKVDAMTKRAATRIVARRCRNAAEPSGCRGAGWVSNGYLAIYYREVDGRAQEWAGGVRYSESGARKRARSRLVGPGQRKVWTWVGTTRHPSKQIRGRELWGQW